MQYAANPKGSVQGRKGLPDQKALMGLRKEIRRLIDQYGSSLPGLSGILSGLLKSLEYTPPPSIRGGGRQYDPRSDRVTF